MEGAMDKSVSDSNVNLVGRNSPETTPPSFVSQRHTKRKRYGDLPEEMDIFREEMLKIIKAQNAQLAKISSTLVEIQQTNRNIENSVAFLASQNEELTKRMENLELQSSKDKEYIVLLEEKVEDLQRSSRKTNIEIKNMPRTQKETKENLINMMNKLGKTINCEINKEDIRDIYRIPGKKNDKNENSPIVVEISSTMLKTDILKMTKVFNIKYREKLRAKHLGATTKEETPIFVSEQLTARGARLFFLARDLAKSKNYRFCWTSYGRVYLRKEENSPIILIKNETQVQHLMSSS